MGDKGMLVALVTALLGTAGYTVDRIFKRIDKKVSKDVFEEFKKGNDKDHATTHAALKRIEDKQ